MSAAGAGPMEQVLQAARQPAAKQGFVLRRRGQL